MTKDLHKRIVEILTALSSASSKEILKILLICHIFAESRTFEDSSMVTSDDFSRCMSWMKDFLSFKDISKRMRLKVIEFFSSWSLNPSLTSAMIGHQLSQLLVDEQEYCSHLDILYCENILKSPSLSLKQTDNVADLIDLMQRRKRRLTTSIFQSIDTLRQNISHTFITKAYYGYNDKNLKDGGNETEFKCKRFKSSDDDVGRIKEAIRRVYETIVSTRSSQTYEHLPDYSFKTLLLPLFKPTSTCLLDIADELLELFFSASSGHIQSFDTEKQLLMLYSHISWMVDIFEMYGTIAKCYVVDVFGTVICKSCFDILLHFNRLFNVKTSIEYYPAHTLIREKLEVFFRLSLKSESVEAVCLELLISSKSIDFACSSSLLVLDDKTSAYLEVNTMILSFLPPTLLDHLDIMSVADHIRPEALAQFYSMYFQLAHFVSHSIQSSNDLTSITCCISSIRSLLNVHVDVFFTVINAVLLFCHDAGAPMEKLQCIFNLVFLNASKISEMKESILHIWLGTIRRLQNQERKLILQSILFTQGMGTHTISGNSIDLLEYIYDVLCSVQWWADHYSSSGLGLRAVAWDSLLQDEIFSSTRGLDDMYVCFLAKFSYAFDVFFRF